MSGRDYLHEEWLAWQDVVTELAALGIGTETLNRNGTALVEAMRYWAYMVSRAKASHSTEQCYECGQVIR